MNTPKKTAGTEKAGTENQNAIELLKADHQEVNQLFEQFKSSKGRQQRKKLIEQIAVALAAHTIIEEEIFYPTCSKHGVDEDNLAEAQVEHDTVKMLVQELLEGSLDDDYYDAKATVLSEYVKHHVKEEEEPINGIFARVEKAGVDLSELGQELKERKEELMEDRERLLEHPPQIRTLDQLRRSSRRSGSRQFGERDQSERFRSEEDYSSRGGHASRQEDDDNDSPRYRSGPSQGGFQEYREFDQGRYRGGPPRERQDRGGYERGRYGRGPGQGPERSEGHGGWFGDPEGHSAASRRGRQRDY